MNPTRLREPEADITVLRTGYRYEATDLVIDESLGTVTASVRRYVLTGPGWRHRSFSGPVKSMTWPLWGVSIHHMAQGANQAVAA